jgi:hypothetical protein
MCFRNGAPSARKTWPAQRANFLHTEYRLQLMKPLRTPTNPACTTSTDRN